MRDGPQNGVGEVTHFSSDASGFVRKPKITEQGVGAAWGRGCHGLSLEWALACSARQRQG